MRAADRPPEPPAHRAPTVLLVDDVPLMLAMYGRYLERAGFHVVTAGSGEAALEQLMNIAPNLIIVDYMMPGMSGAQLVEAIRQRSATRTTPILFLTAVGDDREAIESAFSHGATAYLAKPAAPELFVEMVRSLLA